MNKLKKSLICSAFSMLLCSSMFVGTTYAWFTDNVTVPTNQIVAGNLDIELLAKNESTKSYEKIDENTQIFKKDTLWEPGHVEVVNLQVANVGSLALQYQIGINIVKEQESTSVLGSHLKLSEHIKYALIDGEQTYASRAQAIEAAETAKSELLGALVTRSDYILYPKNKATSETPSEKCMTLIVYMPTTVGNEANHKIGEPTPSIDLGVNLSAKQVPFEEDSFGNQYDNTERFAAAIDGKLYKSLSAALKESKDGETIVLLKDIATYQVAYSPSVSKKLTIDLNQHMIYTPAPTTEETKNYFDWFMVLYNKSADAQADMTIKNGKIDCYGSGFYVYNGAKLTLENVEVNAKGANGKTTYAIDIASYGSSPVTVSLKNSVFQSKEYGIANWNINCNVEIDNCDIFSRAFGVYQNGSKCPAKYTIRNSRITDYACAGIYIANSAGREFQTLILENSIVTGPTAVEVKHTNATINGSTLISTNTTPTNAESGSGSCTSGYSLAVSSNSNTDTVTGTVFVDSTSELKLETGKDADGNPIYETGKVFVFKPEGSTPNLTVECAANYEYFGAYSA